MSWGRGSAQNREGFKSLCPKRGQRARPMQAIGRQPAGPGTIR